MIQAINLRALRNSEFIRYQKNVIGICQAANPIALGISLQVTALEHLIPVMDDLFVKDRGNLITEELEALDARRDAALVGIRMQAESFTYHYDPAIVVAGKALLAAIDKYGRALPRLNYMAETEVIDSLADDVNSDFILNTALNTLKLDAWLKELTTANTAFNNRYLNRNAEYAAQPDAKMLEQRTAAIEAYRSLTEHILAHATITPSAAYTKLIAEIDSLAKQYNLLLASRNAGEELPPANPGENAPPADNKAA